MIYTILLLIFSSELLYSFRAVAQVFISMLMLLTGYLFCTDYFRFQKIIKSLFWVILVGVAATALGYLFGIGKTLEYAVLEENEAGPEFVGLLGSGGLYGPAVALGLLPLILKDRLYPYKSWLIISLSFILYVFILLNVRRTAIFIPIIGYLCFLFFSTSKIKTVRFLFIGLVITGLTFPLYRGLLEKRLNVRIEAGRFEKDFYKTEDRYKENIDMIKSITEYKEPLKTFFGFGNNIFAEHIENGIVVKRMYHSDSAKIFYGEGLLGLILYFIFYVHILYKIIKIPGTDKMNDIKTGALALWSISVFVSINGSLNLMTFRSINFLLLGAFLGFAYSQTGKNGGIPALQEGK